MTTSDEPRVIYEQWIAEEREHRLARFYAKRPPVFAIRGHLDDRAHRWLESMVAGQARTLLLGGATGAGKTWSCWKAVETLLANGWRGGWDIVSAYQLGRLIAPPVDEDRLDHLARIDLLIVDDLGSIPLTDWASAHLLGLVDHRWSHQLPTIVATNLQDLGPAVGSRVASRLADGMVSIPLDGPDRRRIR